MDTNTNAHPRRAYNNNNNNNNNSSSSSSRLVLAIRQLKRRQRGEHNLDEQLLY